MKHKRRYQPYAGRLGSFWLRALLIVVLAGVVCFAVIIVGIKQKISIKKRIL